MKVWRPEDTEGYFKPELNEFQKGVLATGDELQAMGGGVVGMAGQALSQAAPEFAKPTMEKMRDWGLDVYNKNMEESHAGRQAPKVARIEDIKLGEEGGVGRLGDWAVYGGTKALGTMATIVAAGGVGGAAAKLGTKQGIKALAKLEAGNFATRTAQQTAAKQAAAIHGAGATAAEGAQMAAGAAKQLAGNVAKGQIAGATAGAFGLEGGSAFGEQVASGVSSEDALVPSATVGAVNAALELTPFYMAAKAMGFGREARKGLLATISKDDNLATQTRKLAGEVLRRGGPAALGGAAAEGLTEGLQEITQIAGQKWAQETPIFEGWGEEEWSRIKNAAAIGALVGGGMGGVIGQVGRPGEQAGQTTPPPAQETLEEAVARAREMVARRREEMGVRQPEVPLAPEQRPQITPERLKQVQDELLRGRSVEEIVKNTRATEQEVLDIGMGGRIESTKDQEGTIAPQTAKRNELQRGMLEQQLSVLDNSLSELRQKTVGNNPAEEDVLALDQALKQREVMAEELNALAQPSMAENSQTPVVVETGWGWEPVVKSASENTQIAVPYFQTEEEATAAAPQVKQLVENYDNGLINKEELDGGLAALQSGVATQNAPVDQGTPPSQTPAFNPEEIVQESEYSTNSVSQPTWDALTNEYGDQDTIAEEISLYLDDYKSDGLIVVPPNKVNMYTALKEITGGVEGTTPGGSLTLSPAEQTAPAVPATVEELLTEPVSAATEAAPDLTGNIIPYDLSTPELAAGLSQEFSPNVVSALQAIQQSGSLETAQHSDPNVMAGIEFFQSMPEQFNAALEKIGDIAVSSSATMEDPTDYYSQLSPQIQDLLAADHDGNLFDINTNLAAMMDELNSTGTTTTSHASLAQAVGQLTGGQVGSSDMFDFVVTAPQAEATTTSSSGMTVSAPTTWEGVDPNIQEILTTIYSEPVPHSNWLDTFQKAALKKLGEVGSFAEAINQSSGLTKGVLVKWKDDPALLTDLANNGLTALENYNNAANASQTAPAQPQPVAPTIGPDGWSPVGAPGTYIITPMGNLAYRVRIPTGLTYDFDGTLEEAQASAQIHNYLSNLSMPSQEKMEEMKKIPKKSSSLAHYRSVHPYMFKKMLQEEATTKDMADEFLLSAITDAQKFSLDEVFGEMDKYAGKWGESALDAALQTMPSKIVEVPTLSGWVDNAIDESMLLAQNPHKGIWAEAKIDGSGSSARYGVLVINPKTGKVLMRRVANDYEGVTWDFSRGGADRFASVTAGKAQLGPDAKFIETGNPDPAKKFMHHPLQAAKKEAREELGIDVKIIGQVATTFYQGNGETASCYYVGVQQGEFNEAWIEAETKWDEPDTLKGTRWVTMEEAKKLLGQLSELAPDYSMKRQNLGGKTDPNVPMRERQLRQLATLFDKDKQRSAWDYKGNSTGIENYYKGSLAQDFPDDLQDFQTASGLKDFDSLTVAQQLKAAAMAQIHWMNPGLTKEERSIKLKEEVKRRKAALNKWIKSRVPGKTLSDVKQFTNETQNSIQSGVPIVFEAFQGTKSYEQVAGDVYNPKFLGGGTGGSDTKEAFFASYTQKGGQVWAKGQSKRATQKLIMALKNPLVVEWGSAPWNGPAQAQMVKDAKAGTNVSGYNVSANGESLVRDAVIVKKVSDSHGVHNQTLFWNDDIVTGSALEGVGFTGKNFYQSRVPGKPESPIERADAKAVLEREFGKETIGKLLRDGRLRLQALEEEPLVQGVYDGEKDQVSLFLENIGSEGELLGAFLHEGRHARLDEILGESLEAYYKDFMRLYRNGVKSARTAVEETALQGARRFGIEMDHGLQGEARREEIRRVREILKEIDPGYLGQEDLAHFIQASVQTGQKTSLITRLLNAIRVWFAQTSLGKKLKAAGWGSQLTEEMAVALARASVKEFAHEKRNSTGKQYAFIGHTTATDWGASPGFPNGKPDLSHIGTGEGYMSFGWGWYALEGKGTLKFYQESIAQAKGIPKNQMHLLGFHMPDEQAMRVLEWDRPLAAQQPLVQAAIRSPKDGFLLLKIARKARERATRYPSGPKVAAAYNAGPYSLYYSESMNAGPAGQFVLIKPNKSNPSYPLDKEYVAGAKEFLDLAASKGTLAPELEALRKSGKAPTEMKAELRKLLDVNKQGTGSSLYNELRDYLWEKNYGKSYSTKNKARKDASLFLKGSGVLGVHYLDAGSRETGHGTYNWVLWDQASLDKLTMIWKNKQKVGEIPLDVSYDPNAQGEKFPQAIPDSELVLDKTGAWLYSRTGQVRDTSQAELEEVLEGVFGKAWVSRAKELDLLRVYKGKGPEGISGFYDRDSGSVSLFAQSMPADENPLGVVLHEGSHQTLRVMLGNEVTGRLARDVRGLAESENPNARMALARSEWEGTAAAAAKLGVEHSMHEELTTEEQKKELERVKAKIQEKLKGLSQEARASLQQEVNFVRDEELLSYFVQFAAKDKGGMWRRIVNQTKVAWLESDIGQGLKAVGLGPMASDEMMVALARRATEFGVELRKTAREIAKREGIVPSGMTKEGQMLAARFFHGTPEAWALEQPSLDLGADALRADARGWGFYGTEDFDTAEPYSLGTGPVYEFDLPDEAIPFLLKWDAPMTGQTEEVKGLIEALGLGEREETGGEFYERLTSMMGSKKNASQLLAAAGVLGTTFGDQGTGAKNFNLWDRYLLGQVTKVGEKAGVLASRFNWIDQNALYTDPLSSSIDISHNPGAFNSIYQNWVEQFSDLWAKAPHVARTFGLAKSKKGTQQQAISELLRDPFVELGRKSGLSQEVLDAGFAAQHVLLDRVNLENARVKADKFAKELIGVLPDSLAKKLKARRDEIRKSVTKGGVLSEDARAEMKDEVDKVMGLAWGTGFVKDLPKVRELYVKWERVKDYSGGFSTGEGDASVLEAGVPNAQAALDKVKNNPQWQEMNKLWQQLIRSTLDVLVDGDLLTPEVGGELTAKYKHYAPLKREGYALPQELQTLMAGGGRTIQDRFGAEGYLKVVGVMQNGFAQRDSAIAAAEKNLALQVFAEDVRNNPQTWKGWFTVEERKLTEQGKDALGFESKTVGKLDPTDMPFVKDGKGFVIKPSDGNVRAAKIAGAINGLEIQNQTGPMKVMQAVNSWVRAVNVSLSPVFMVMNPPRDFSTALLNLQSTEIAGSWKDVAGEYKKSFMQLKKYYWDNHLNRDYADPDIKMVGEWEDEGGRMSFVQSLRPDDEGFGSVGKMIERRQGKWKIPGTTVELKSGMMGEAWTKAAGWMDKIERANIMMENVMRFSTYKVYVREGMKKLEGERASLTTEEFEAAAAEVRAQGAQLSKDITTNFDRKGFRAQTLGTFYVFFNATMQGNAQVIRNLLTGPHRGRMMKAVGGMMAVSLLMDLMAGGLSDDEDGDGRSDWDSIPDWQKEKQIFFPVGFGGEDETYLSVPAPWVFNVFWRTGQMVGEVLRGVRDVGSLGPEVAGLTATTMSPIGGKTMMQIVAPTALDPFMQIAENRGPFGEKLHPESFPGDVRPDSQLGWSSTPQIYKDIAEGLNKITGGNVAESGWVDFAPGDVKILSDFVLGSTGRLFAGLTGDAVGLVKGEGLPEVGTVPGLKAYLVNPKDPKESGLFHERVALVHGAERAKKLGVEGERRELGLLGYAKDAERQVKALRKQLRSAELQGRDEQGERVKKRIDRVYEQFNQTWARRMGN